MLFDSTLLTVVLLSELESVLSYPAIYLSTKFTQYSKSFAAISTIFTAFHQEQVLSQETTLFVHKKQLHKIEAIQLPFLQVLISNSSSLAISTTSTFLSSNEVLNPSKSSTWVGISFFLILVNVDILSSSNELLMFLMINPFQRFPGDFVQIHQRNYRARQLQFYKVYFLNNKT